MRCVGHTVKLWGYYMDICQSYKCLDNQNRDVAETCSRAFVSDIINLVESLDGYFKYIVKYNKVSTRGLNSRDIVKRCVELDYLEESLAESIIDFKTRWELTHDGFGRPPVHIAIEFFKDAELELGYFLRSLKSISHIKKNGRVV